MSSTTLNQVNSKLKKLPETLLEDVERYIDFLTFKHNQDTSQVPQWHKDIVSNRINDSQEPVDAFKMIDELEVE